MTETSSIYNRADEPARDRRNRRQEAEIPQEGQAGKAIVVDKKLEKFIRDSASRVVSLQQDRTSINQEITSIFTELESKGLNRKAVKAALRRYQQEEVDRAEQDVSYGIVCKALGIEHQAALDLQPAGDDATH